MIPNFKEWFETRKSWLRDNGLEYALSQSQYSDESIYADVDTTRFIGRITFWSTGECDLEAIDIASEKRVFWYHMKINNSLELSKALEQFCHQML